MPIDQEAVDGDIDLNNLYWECSAPGDKRPPVYLLLPTSSTPHTHKVRFSKRPWRKYIMMKRVESGGCQMGMKTYPGLGSKRLFPQST